MEIVYSRTGSGIQQVHETSYVLAPGALAVIGQNQLHAYTPCDTEADLLVLQFDAAAFLNGSQAGGRMGEAWLAGRLFFDAPVPAGPEMGRLLERIHAELKGRPDGYQTAVTADVRGCWSICTAPIGAGCPRFPWPIPPIGSGICWPRHSS